MTPQEAIKTLKVEYLGDSDNIKLAKEMGVIALEKQIPKEPKQRHSKKWGDRYNDGECPNCGASYSDGLSDTPLYCSQCGQAFEWGEENGSTQA